MFFNLGNADVLYKSMALTGFNNIIVESLNSPLEYASGEEACIAAFAGGPVALPYHKFSNAIKE